MKHVQWVELRNFWKELAPDILDKKFKKVIVDSIPVCFSIYLPCVIYRIEKYDFYSSSSKSIRNSVRFAESSMASFSDISSFFDFSRKAEMSKLILPY
jgi:hypothetical protein